MDNSRESENSLWGQVNLEPDIQNRERFPLKLYFGEEVGLSEAAWLLANEDAREQSSGIGLKVGPYNAALYNRRRQLGLSQNELAKLAKVSNITISHLETLRKFPSQETAQKIAQALGIEISAVFPAWLEEFTRDSSQPTQVRIEIPMSQVNSTLVGKALRREALSSADPTEEEAEAANLKQQTKKVLAGLSQRHQRTLTLRFGLEDDRDRTLKEIGQELGVHGARVGQIEKSALRKLRHPSRAGELVDFVKLENSYPVNYPDCLKNDLVNALHLQDLPRAGAKLTALDEWSLEGVDPKIRDLVGDIFQDPDFYDMRPEGRASYLSYMVWGRVQSLKRAGVPVQGIESKFTEQIPDLLKEMNQTAGFRRQLKTLQDAKKQS